MTTRFADVLQQQWTGVAVSFKWWGISRAVGDDDKERIANYLGADADDITAGKKLIDTKDAIYRDCTKVKSRCGKFWQTCTIDYPEKGVRLLKRAKIDEFTSTMSSYIGQLDQAVAALQDHYYDLRVKARHDLGSLFDPNDYPERIDNLFGISFAFPSLAPPDFLQEGHEHIWNQMQARLEARLEQAAIDAERQFTEEFAKLVEKLSQGLSYDENGNPKRLHGAHVDNLRSFFGRFRDLSLGSNEDLDSLVSRAEQLLSDTRPDELRHNVALRDVTRQSMNMIQTQLTEIINTQPKRAISFED